jgi:hypothetical protein
MPCKICIKLEEAVAAFVRPDRPGILLGLTEAGTCSLARQEEKLRLKAKIDIEKHQRAFHRVADNPMPSEVRARRALCGRLS